MTPPPAEGPPKPLADQHRELYEKLQGAVSITRYVGRHESDLRAAAEPTSPVLSTALDLIAAYEDPQTAPQDTQDERVGATKAFMEHARTVLAAVDELGDTELQTAMRKESYERLFAYAFNGKAILSSIRDLQAGMKERHGKTAQDPDSINVKTIDDDAVNDKAIKTLERIFKEVLPFYNPESFLAHYLLSLRANKRELNTTGIVTTESLGDRDELYIKTLHQNGLLALVGETGSGKTQEARKLGREFFRQNHPGEAVREPYFVSCNRYTSREDLIGYLGLGKEEPKTPEEILNLTQEAKQRFREQHPEITGSDLEAKDTWIDEVMTRIHTNPQLQTQEFVGLALKGAEEGVTVIFDEFNYADPGLLPAIYDIIQAPVGSTITTPGGRTFQKKAGSANIFTGNMTMEEMEAEVKRYKNRQDIDPALADRLNGGLFEYHTPPQEEIDDPLQTSIIKDDGRKEGQKPKKRELFQIGLAVLTDDKGNLYGPSETLEQTWKLAQAFKLFQDNFAGKPIRQDDKLGGKINYRLQSRNASMRAYTEILKKWKTDLYKNPLEYYLYAYLVRSATVQNPKDASYFYTVLKEKYSFFSDSYWQNKLTEDNDHRLKLAGEVRAEETVRPQHLRIFTAAEVAQAYSGYEMPREIRDIRVKGAQPELSDDRIQEKIAQMEERVQKIKQFILDFGGRDLLDETGNVVIDPETGKAVKDPEHPGTLALFCQDETAIGKAA